MAGQERLSSASIAIAGVGGLGAPNAQYLAAAGVGKIRLIDPDPVDITNLNRQVLHFTKDAVNEKKKVRSAAEKLNALNPDVIVEEVVGRIDDDNASRLLGRADVIVDCLDNFEGRLALNKHCVSNGTPMVHAAVEGWRGQMTTVIPGRTPCISCLVPRPPHEEGPIPIMGATAGTFGCLQAAEVLKLLLGLPGTLAGRLLLGDLATQSWETLEIVRNPQCSVCSRHHSP